MAGAFFFGFSATLASVVMSRPATDAASCRAARTTFAGSITPWLHQVAILAGRGVVAEGVVVLLDDLADNHGAVLAGVLGDLPRRCLKGAEDEC